MNRPVEGIARSRPTLFVVVRRMARLALAVTVLAALSAVEPCPGDGPSSGLVSELAIDHVTVLPMTVDGSPIGDATVVIRAGRIGSISRTGEARLPSDVRRVNGKGKWLMPALADCHMHLENDRVLRFLSGDASLPDGTVDDADLFVPFVANGILQVANLAAMSE